MNSKTIPPGQADVVDMRAVKVSELMQKDLVTLSGSATLGDAIRVLEEYHISGAPVVDGGGRPIGVLSMSDVHQADHSDGGRLEEERREYYFANPLDEEDDEREFITSLERRGWSVEMLGAQRVQDVMTPNLISVSPDAPMVEACKLMHEESIHRVLVIESEMLVGIVTTSDVVRFLATHA